MKVEQTQLFGMSIKIHLPFLSYILPKEHITKDRLNADTDPKT